MRASVSLPPLKDKYQQSIDDFWSSITDIQMAVHWHYSIINELALNMGKNASDNIATNS